MGLFDFFTNSAQAQRKSHLKNLLQVGMADGNLDQVELKYLIDLARKLKMPEDELQEILSGAEKVKFSPPSSFEAKVDQLHDLVHMMVINGEVHEQELKICKSFALKLDILPKMVDDLVDQMVHRTRKGESREEIVKELSSLNLN